MCITGMTCKQVVFGCFVILKALATCVLPDLTLTTASEGEIRVVAITVTNPAQLHFFLSFHPFLFSVADTLVSVLMST